MLVAAEIRSRLAAGAASEASAVGGLRANAAPTDSLWIAAPARVEATGLQALLGIAHQLGLQVEGFVDSATAVAAALGPLDDQENATAGRSAIVLELGLHHAAATAVDCEAGQARRRRIVCTERGGLMELYQAWLDLISTTMVKRSRFDPLHDANTEQQLFDSMPTLTDETAAAGVATATVSKGKEHFEVALTRDQFAQTAEPIYRAILALLHQLRPAGSPVDIVMPRQAAELPGMRPFLEEFVGCRLVSVPDGFAAAATSLFDDLPATSGQQDAVRMLRRLPLRKSPLEASVLREELGQRRAGGPVPSHVLHEGRAYALNTESLVVGRTSAGIRLLDGLAGVSRRHCTFLRDGDELVLLDHSTFGTFVNGERVHERVRVHAGDRVRVGEPGVELSLIAVGDRT
jgi:hypothetical protein